VDVYEQPRVFEIKLRLKVKVNFIIEILSFIAVVLGSPLASSADLQATTIRHCSREGTTCIEISAAKADLSQFQQVLVLKNAMVREFKNKNEVSHYQTPRATINLNNEEIVMSEVTGTHLLETKFKMNSLEKSTYRTVL
jgi:hypothetical protein